MLATYGGVSRKGLIPHKKAEEGAYKPLVSVYVLLWLELCDTGAWYARINLFGGASW